jgi:branched-chain amino acid transport system permease protein
MANIVVQGILVGGVYALIALGVCLLIKSSDVLNLAYGPQMLLLAYVLYWLTTSAGLPVWLAVLLVMVSGALLGLLIERVAIRPLLGGSFLPILIITLMVGYVIQDITTLLWGGNAYFYPFASTRMLSLGGGIYVSPSLLYGFFGGLGVFILLYFVFRYTSIGLAFRVIAADHRVATSLGIRVRRVLSISWLASGALAGISALLFGMIQMVTPEMGSSALVNGLTVLLLGGMNSIPGALVGGLTMALIQYVGGYYSGQLRPIIPWLVMLVILFFRPWGLFGERRIERI